MNEAIVREPTDQDYCPCRSSRGEPVGNKTLGNYLTEEQQDRLGVFRLLGI